MKNRLDKLDFMEGYLLGFNPNVHKYKDEDEAVKRYLDNPKKGKDSINGLLQEGQEVLSMEPFPYIVNLYDDNKI